LLQILEEKNLTNQEILKLEVKDKNLTDSCICILRI
jgi:hypothetical protein